MKWSVGEHGTANHVSVHCYSYPDDDTSYSFHLHVFDKGDMEASLLINGKNIFVNIEDTPVYADGSYILPTNMAFYQMMLAKEAFDTAVPFALKEARKSVARLANTLRVSR